MTAFGAALSLAVLPGCSIAEVKENLGVLAPDFEPNDQLRSLVGVLREARVTADAEAQAFIDGQIGILEEEFYRQCGVDAEGQRHESCDIELSPAGAGQAKAEEQPGGATTDREETFADIQKELLAAIANPQLPDAQGREEDQGDRQVNRQQYQTQLLTGLYAATAPVAGTPSTKTVAELLGDPQFSGAARGGAAEEELARALDEVYGAIQAAGLALAASPAGSETHEAIAAAGDDARTARDILGMLIATPDSEEESESQAQYQPPAGFSLDPSRRNGIKVEEAPAFLHSALAAPLSRVRQMAGEVDSEQSRSALAQAAAVLSRAQGKLELIQGIDPAKILLRGGA